MNQIISASRRTDIPAFYGEWFVKRIEDGFVGFQNPMNPGQRSLISLKPQDVVAFVFWSKNYAPFLKAIAQQGFRFSFNFTITGLPSAMEPGVPPLDAVVATAREMSKEFSPASINWRYDPIVLSDVTDLTFHLKTFSHIAAALEGAVQRCVFSFVIQTYKKVERAFSAFSREFNVRFDLPTLEERREIAGKLAEVARKHGIAMLSCCESALASGFIKASSCVDSELLQRLFPEITFSPKRHPTRLDCG